MALQPSDKLDPRIAAFKTAVVSLAKAHLAVLPLYPSGTIREGTITATRVDDVLIVSAEGDCAYDLEMLMEAALLAQPEQPS